PATTRSLARVGLPLFAVMLFVGSHWPKLTLTEDGPTPWMSLDKFAHVVGYATLAMLIYASGLGGGVGRKLRLRGWWGAGVGTVLACTLYALVDESTQPLIGRQMT
ncbi:unnamed protein product, partial [Ectocarpus fasciculatus]